MNKYLKLIIPAALLLTTTSVFAQKQSFEGLMKEKIKSAVSEEISNDLKTALQNAYNEKQKSINGICNNDKYCLENAYLMLRSRSFSYDKVIAELEKATNHKQALYNTKYAFAKKNAETYEILQMAELSKIAKLDSFKEIQDYITDMPVLGDSFDTALEILSSYITHKNPTKEEVKFVKSFGQELSKDLPLCAKDLNVNDYGYENICALPENRAAKKHFVKKVEKLFMDTVNRDPEQKEDAFSNEYDQMRKDVNTFVTEWKNHTW